MLHNTAKNSSDNLPSYAATNDCQLSIILAQMFNVELSWLSLVTYSYKLVKMLSVGLDVNQGGTKRGH